MGRPKGGKNKYWTKEEKLKLIKEHLEMHVSTLEITNREHISNGMYNNWLRKYLELGEKGSPFLDYGRGRLRDSRDEELYRASDTGGTDPDHDHRPAQTYYYR
jgi:transposase-like protein